MKSDSIIFLIFCPSTLQEKIMVRELFISLVTLSKCKWFSCVLLMSPYVFLILESSPGRLSWVQGRCDIRDIPPPCAHQLSPFLKCFCVLRALAGPHHCPQVSECSCSSWSLCHRRKQCADWGPILKTHRKERRKDSDHTHGPSSHPNGPEFDTYLYNLTLVLVGKTEN